MMENDDKIFEKIRHASLNPEAEHFPSMDKVWSRVESKLDNKVLKKQNKLWKKIAVAASFLLIFTLSYQVFKPTEPALELPISKPKQQPASEKNQNVLTDTDTETATSTALKQPHSDNTPLASKPAIIPAPASESISETVASEETISYNLSGNADLKEEPKAAAPVLENDAQAKAKDYKDTDDDTKRKGEFQGQVFDARSVKRESASAKKAKRPEDSQAEKSAPLMVVDGKAITAKTDKQALRQGLSEMDPDDVANIVVLDDPLYIINGHQYNEQELFGPHPTSPYHPLGQQQIETLSILQGEKAIAAYGKKGQKGVVIITTKNGKPTPVRKE
jgi:hypothetical protein